MPPHTTITIHPGGESSRSDAYHSEEESSRHEADYSAADGDDEWQPEEDDLNPSDSASLSNDIPQSRPRAARGPSRRRVPHNITPQYTPVQAHAPIPPPSVESSDEFGGHYGAGYQPQQPPRGTYYSGRGQHPSYQQPGHYMGGYPGGNQMVPYGGFAPNPFTPMTNSSSGASYFSGEPRHMYDMAPYQHAYYPAPQYALPTQMQQFHLTSPGGPAHGADYLPNPNDPSEVEKKRLEAEVLALKAQEQKVRAAEAQRDREAQIRKDAEDAFQKRMEDMKKAQEEAQKEIQRARDEAEKAAMERIKAERKAEEERQRLHEEAMKRAEERARRKFETEMEEQEARRKREEAERFKAEEAAKVQLELAIKKEAAAREAAEQKVKDEEERLRLVKEEARRKAEEETLAKVEEEKKKAKKEAEAAEAAKKEQEAFKKRIAEETKASLEEAAKKGVKAPIFFKDAVERTYQFPFHRCAKWSDMEDLIKQAFANLDVLGPHVYERHYDLLGTNGEIILPTVWDKTIQPGMEITMTMWPMDKGPAHMGQKIHGMSNMPGRRGRAVPIPPPVGGAPQSRRSGATGAGVIPPGGWTASSRRHSTVPANVDIVDADPRASKSGKSKRNSAVLTFFAGKQQKKKPAKK